MERRFASSLEAQEAGIAIIHQELNLVPHLSIAENIYLAREPKRGPFIDRARLNGNAQRALARIGLSLPPTRLVGTLSIAQQQMVEIAKALSLDAQVLIMAPAGVLHYLSSNALHMGQFPRRPHRFAGN